MEKEIIDKLSEYNLTYVKIDNNNLFPIWNIFFNYVVDNTNETNLYLFYLGVYYEFLVLNNKLAIKYYSIAIDRGSIIAIKNLALLYDKQNKYDSAEKYYLMAVEKNNNIALNDLAVLYEKNNKCDLAELYYLMAIENNVIIAMVNLANLYKRQNKYDLVEKYFLMFVENINNIPTNNINIYIKAMINLINMYTRQNRYDLVQKYYLMLIDKNVVTAMYDLACIYEKQNKYESAKQYYLMAVFNYNSNAQKRINDLLKKKFDIELAIKVESFLDNENNQILNQILVYIYKNKNSNFGGRLVDNMDCASCGNTGTIIFMNCSHPLCIDCYEKDKTCRICL